MLEVGVICNVMAPKFADISALGVQTQAILLGTRI